MATQEPHLSLEDKEFRHFYLSAHIRELLAQQIRATREQRGWTQADLGERAGMAQERISLLEDPDYSGATLKTLKRIAEAFDTALIVRYTPFSELLNWVEHMNPEQLAVPSFDNDAGLLMPERITIPGPFMLAADDPSVEFLHAPQHTQRSSVEALTVDPPPAYALAS